MSQPLVTPAVPPEACWYLSSAERLRDGKDATNPTNDITIPLRNPRPRLPVTHFTLSTLELPVSQYLVESLWNKLYFSEGLRLQANSLIDSSVREFVVTLDGTQYVAELPLWLNAIVDVDTTDPLHPVLTTEFSHGLDMYRFWTWDPIQLIGTDLTESDPDVVRFTADNTSFTILNARQFRLDLTGVAVLPTWTNTSGAFAYLHAPAIPNPVILAQLVTEALNLMLPGSFSVTYNKQTGLFTFKSLRPVIDVCTTKFSPNVSESIYITIPSANALPALMGFGFCAGGGNVPVLPVQASANTFLDPDRSRCLPDETCIAVQTTGQFKYQCKSVLTVPPGDYTADTIRSQLMLQWNRFWFSPGESGDPADRPFFVWSDASGTVILTQVEFGLYTPQQFATQLEALMNNTDTQGNTYSVNFVTGSSGSVFVFSSNGGTPFGLEFGTGTDTVHSRIGFQGATYRGLTSYTSTDPFSVPLRQCCNVGDTAYLSNVYAVSLNSANGIFCFHASSLPCWQVAGTRQADGTISLTSSPARALGFQVDDVVEFTESTSGDTFKTRVLQVPSAFTIVVDGASMGLPDTFDASVCPSGIPFLNIFWNTSNTTQLPPGLLGFRNTDALWTSGTVLCAPFPYNLRPPDYVLVWVQDPAGTTHNTHTANGQTIPELLAKVVLYPNFRLERLYPLVMYLPQVKTITQMSFILLNPDHTPYQLHGKEWSGTICFATNQVTSANQLAE